MGCNRDPTASYKVVEYTMETGPLAFAVDEQVIFLECSFENIIISKQFSY